MRTEYQTYMGEGPQDQVFIPRDSQVVCSATGPIIVLVGGKPQRAVFRMPAEIDFVQVQCDPKVMWALRYAPCKPKQEQLDPTPVAIPVGSHQPESLESLIARMVRSRVDQLAVAGGYGPSQEEEDFEDEEDDELPKTRYEYEETARQAERAQEAMRYAAKRIAEARARREKKKAAEAAPPPPPAEPAELQPKVAAK